MKKLQTKEVVDISLYAALIVISVQFLRIPIGPQFVHLGNALVVVAVLLFGTKRASLIACLGLGIFDILNGYAAEVWITLLEAVIVCVLIGFIFEKWMASDDSKKNVVIIAFVAALTKIILNLFKYTFINLVVASLPMNAALISAFVKIIGTFGTSLVTIIAVPILYPIFKSFLGKK
ncbi:ECF transporter S component [Streptococcus catagoni]|uniref:ECF transporter S component n=1 Tax=Streptococcus catagoni TaxID=2654874 RepID=UPI00140C4BEC|nr:ECF transporter S component [Streptococcus catagoni]